jgi:hypothetical protein
MRKDRLIISALFAGAVSVMAACSGDWEAPESQTTTGVRERMEPTTVTGCLRAGVVADQTFVLTAMRAEGASESATYHLTGLEGVELGDHVGQQVEVSGILRAEQEVVSISGPAEVEKKAEGTPVVETRTEVDVKRLDVSAVRPTGQPCEG